MRSSILHYDTRNPWRREQSGILPHMKPEWISHLANHRPSSSSLTRHNHNREPLNGLFLNCIMAKEGEESKWIYPILEF